MYPGYYDENLKILNRLNADLEEKLKKIRIEKADLDTINKLRNDYTILSTLHVDWEMALYTAKKQIKAQSAY